MNPATRLLSRLLAENERDAVLGDLEEARATVTGSLAAIAGLIARRQVACWQGPRPWIALLIALPIALLLATTPSTLAQAFERHPDKNLWTLATATLACSYMWILGGAVARVSKTAAPSLALLLACGGLITIAMNARTTGVAYLLSMLIYFAPLLGGTAASRHPSRVFALAAGAVMTVLLVFVIEDAWPTGAWQWFAFAWFHWPALNLLLAAARSPQTHSRPAFGPG